jgi:hypothetical protein
VDSILSIWFFIPPWTTGDCRLEPFVLLNWLSWRLVERRRGEGDSNVEALAAVNGGSCYFFIMSLYFWRWSSSCYHFLMS